MQAVGSGAIISKDGYWSPITMWRPRARAWYAPCEREEIEAELVGTDPLTDISVLKLKPEITRDSLAASFGIRQR